MRFLSILMVFSVFFLISCGGNMTPNGYKIIKEKEGTGGKPAVGDYSFVHVYVNVDGVLQTSTREQGQLMPARIPPMEELKKMKKEGRPNPIQDAISLMSVGDSVSVEVPVTDEMRKSPQLSDAKNLVYQIVMVESLTEAEYDARKAEEMKLLKEQEAKVKAVEATIKSRESDVANEINKIAKRYKSGRLNKKIKKTDSGLKYMIVNEGTGLATQNDQETSVHYYGALTNGKEFDNSFKRGIPYKFPLGQGRVIKGWDEGVALLKSGDQAFLFVPSALGYGKAGSPPAIPEDSELIFYIEVL